MKKNSRKRIGVVYNFSTKWMGGVIYILNAIKILNWLEDDKQPEVVLFYRKDLKKFVDEIEYPHLTAVEWEFPSIYKGYITSWLSGSNKFIDPICKQYELDAVFPMHDFPVKSGSKVQEVCWYADLQHKHYPQFFSNRKIMERDARIRLILKNTKHLVLSSRSVLNDFKKFFKVKPDVNVHIFHFASVVDRFDFSGWEDLLRQHRLPQKYFLVSNQFHKHKNHKVLLESLALLKKEGKKPFLAMSGKLPDDSSAPHVLELKELMEQHDLKDQICFLGVLSRQEQLTLMRYAQAVIQPSLFEGWSTVIEDAISLQTPVIASNLAVNIEQLGDWGVFFDPHDLNALASLMNDNFERTDFDKVIYEPYDQRIKRAAESFAEVFNV